MGLSNNLSNSREAGSLSCCCPNPQGLFQSEVCGFISLRWSPGLLGLLRSPPLVPFASVGPWGPTRTLPALFSATLSPAFSVYLHKCGAAGSASGQTACPVRPTLRPSRSHQGNTSPLRPSWLPVSAPPTGLDECLFFISLVSDFFAFRFSVSSGCARRRSVSTYAAILVLPKILIF